MGEEQLFASKLRGNPFSCLLRWSSSAQSKAAVWPDRNTALHLGQGIMGRSKMMVWNMLTVSLLVRALAQQRALTD